MKNYLILTLLLISVCGPKNSTANDTLGATNKESTTNNNEKIESNNENLSIFGNNTGLFFEFKDESDLKLLKDFESRNKENLDFDEFSSIISDRTSVSINSSSFIHDIYGTEGVYTYCEITHIKKKTKTKYTISCKGFNSKKIVYVEADDGIKEDQVFELKIQLENNILLYGTKKFYKMDLAY